MAEYQRHPLARPHDVGQDFWAVGYAGPSLMDRQRYIDPRTGQVWESLEEALRFLSGPTDYQQWDELGGLPDDPNIEAVMPDIRAGIPPGPPFEATFRASQAVPSVLPERRITAPDVVTGLLEAPDTGVTISESTYDYDQAQREADLQRAIRREETDPPYDREAELRDAIRREAIKPPPVQVANIPVNPPIRLENVVDIPPQHTPKPTNLKPFMSPLLSEPYTQTGIGTSTTLPGGKIVNGNLILDEAGWDEWLEQEERRALDRALDFDNLDEQVQNGLLDEPTVMPEGVPVTAKSHSEWKALGTTDVNEAVELAEAIATTNRGGKSFTDEDYDPSFVIPSFSGISRVLGYIREDNPPQGTTFLPKGAIKREVVPGIPTAKDISRIELKAGEWKYPGFRYPNLGPEVSKYVFDPKHVGELNPEHAPGKQTVGVVNPFGVDATTKFKDPSKGGATTTRPKDANTLLTGAWGGIVIDQGQRELVNMLEARDWPGEYEFHEDFHIFNNALSRIPNLWDDVEVELLDGSKKKIIDIVFPVVRGERTWDKEMGHILIYASSRVAPIITRIVRDYGGGTELNPDIFDGLSPKEKIETAQILLGGMNQAGIRAADAFDKVEDGKLEGKNWIGGVMYSGYVPSSSKQHKVEEGLTTTTPDKSDTPTARELKGQAAKDAWKRKRAEASRQDKFQSRIDIQRALPRTTFEKTLEAVGTFPNDTAKGRNAWYGKWQNKGNEKVGTAYLAPDAASDYKRMNKAFKAKFGRDIRIESAYRTNLHNEALKKKGAVQTSKHKEGTALDITSKKERDWIIKNGADKYGWIWHNYKDKKGKRGTSNHFYHIGKRKTTSR